jgi:hypothetical protein
MIGLCAEYVDATTTRWVVRAIRTDFNDTAPTSLSTTTLFELGPWINANYPAHHFGMTVHVGLNRLVVWFPGAIYQFGLVDVTSFESLQTFPPVPLSSIPTFQIAPSMPAPYVDMVAFDGNRNGYLIISKPGSLSSS